MRLSACFMVSLSVLERKIPGSRHDRNHLPCRCIWNLISLSLKQAEAKPEGFRPLNTGVPADPHNQAEYCRQNMAAQVPNPKTYASFKNVTKSETAIKCFGKICFRVPSFCLRLLDVSCNAVTDCRQNPQQSNYISI